MADLVHPTITPKIEERFWSRVDKTPGQGPNGDCWCWTGGIQNDGKYPHSINIQGKMYRPSHVAMTLDGRPRPSMDMEGLHSCDNPPCVRPSHLRWGTGEENRQEYLERRKPSKRALSAEIVREIRASDERHVDIARRLRITSACVHNIRKRVSHKHIK